MPAKSVTYVTNPPSASSGSGLTMDVFRAGDLPAVPFAAEVWPRLPGDEDPETKFLKTVDILVTGKSGSQLTFSVLSASPRQITSGDMIEVDTTRALVLPAWTFGADPSLADNSTQLQAALDAAAAAGGGVVQTGLGTYFAKNLSWPSNVVIQGVDQWFSIIKLPNASNSDIIAATNKTKLGARNISFDGNYTGQTSGFGINVNLTTCSNVEFENVRIYNARWSCISTIGGSHREFRNIEVSGSQLANGFQASQGLFLSLVNSRFYNCTNTNAANPAGIDAQALSISDHETGCVIHNCIVHSSTHGYYVNPTRLTALSISNGGGVSAAVITKAAHGLLAGDPLQLLTDNALPAGLSMAVPYFVATSPAPTANTFSVALSPSGAAVITSSAGAGTHSLYARTCQLGRVSDVYSYGHSGYAFADGGAYGNFTNINVYASGYGGGAGGALLDGFFHTVEGMHCINNVGDGLDLGIGIGNKVNHLVSHFNGAGIEINMGVDHVVTNFDIQRNTTGIAVLSNFGYAAIQATRNTFNGGVCKNNVTYDLAIDVTADYTDVRDVDFKPRSGVALISDNSLTTTGLYNETYFTAGDFSGAGAVRGLAGASGRLDVWTLRDTFDDRISGQKPVPGDYGGGPIAACEIETVNLSAVVGNFFRIQTELLSVADAATLDAVPGSATQSVTSIAQYSRKKVTSTLAFTPVRKGLIELQITRPTATDLADTVGGSLGILGARIRYYGNGNQVA